MARLWSWRRAQNQKRGLHQPSPRCKHPPVSSVESNTGTTLTNTATILTNAATTLTSTATTLTDTATTSTDPTSTSTDPATTSTLTSSGQTQTASTSITNTTGAAPNYDRFDRSNDWLQVQQSGLAALANDTEPEVTWISTSTSTSLPSASS
ncbi:hypothetical protein VTN96DRAFT_1992 [Rasamsonia emersonii]